MGIQGEGKVTRGYNILKTAPVNFITVRQVARVLDQLLPCNTQILIVCGAVKRVQFRVLWQLSSERDGIDAYPPVATIAATALATPKAPDSTLVPQSVPAHVYRVPNNIK